MVKWSELEDKWNNKGLLELYLLEIVKEQLDLAEKIASEEMSLNNAFVNEKEESFKATDAMAKARAKQLVGANRTQYEYEFEALNNLFKAVTLRISQL